MRNSHLKHLRTQREELEAKLELHIARYCFGDGEVDDGTEAELRQRITEVSDEIARLESERGE
jgi:vacuolar-type H+-ATPase subunit I/STV1